MRIIMNIIDSLKNRFYNIFDKERSCSKCRYLNERPSITSRIVAIRGGITTTHTIKKCSRTNTIIDDRTIYSKNCVHFERKYGSAPIIRKIRRLKRYSERQWRLHYKIIIFSVGTILTIISILVTKSYI
jgi:hypothetical protein